MNNTPFNTRDVDVIITKHKSLLTELEISVNHSIAIGINVEDNNDTLGGDLINQLELSVIDYIKLETNINNHIAALNQVKNTIIRNYGNENQNQNFNARQMLEEKLGEVQGVEDEEQIKKHPKFREFRQKVWAVHHPNEPLPDDDDEELVMVGNAQSESNVCPITKTELIEPVKNTACGHTYSKHAILQYIQSKIKGRKQEASCPVVGCSKKVSPNSLKQDKEAEQRIKRAKRNKKTDNTDDYQDL